MQLNTHSVGFIKHWTFLTPLICTFTCDVLGNPPMRPTLRQLMHFYLCYLPSQSSTEYRQSARLSLQSSQLGPNTPSPAGECCPPLVPSVQPNSVTSYVRLPVLPALLCFHATVLRQGVHQCSQTPWLPMYSKFTCVVCSPLSPRYGSPLVSPSVQLNSVTPYVGLPVLPALLCLHATVLHLWVLQCSQLLCTFTCVACPPLSLRYGAPPGSPSVQPNSVTPYERLPLLPALLRLHATVLRQGVLQCSQTQWLPMNVYLCCLPSSVSTLRCSARESSRAAHSVTTYARLPVLPALLCLHATVLRQGVLQGSQALLHVILHTNLEQEESHER